MSDMFNFKDADIYVLDQLVKEGDIELGRGDVISKIDIRDTPGPYPIYSSSAQRNGKMGEYGKFMFDEEMITWSVDGGGKFFHRPKHKFSVTNVCGYLRLKSNRLNYRYLHSVLSFQHDRLSFDYQTKAHPSVIRDLYQVPLLKYKEQRKIAEILTSVDEVIEDMQSQINKLEDLKKATMNELLTKGIGHTEFKDTEIGRIPSAWELLSFGEVFEIQLGKMMNKNDRESSVNQFSFLANANVQWQRVNLKNLGKMSFSDSERKKFSLKCGDLLVCEGGEVGRTAIWRGEKRDCFYQKAIHRCRVNQGRNDNPEFFMYLMKHYAYHDAFKKFVGQTSIAHLTKENLQKIKLFVPSIKEQREITEILTFFDANIDINFNNLEYLKNLKHSLMQDLLTGKVRVTVN